MPSTKKKPASTQSNKAVDSNNAAKSSKAESSKAPESNKSSTNGAGPSGTPQRTTKPHKRSRSGKPCSASVHPWWNADTDERRLLYMPPPKEKVRRGSPFLQSMQQPLRQMRVQTTYVVEQFRAEKDPEGKGKEQDQTDQNERKAQDACWYDNPSPGYSYPDPTWYASQILRTVPALSPSALRFPRIMTSTAPYSPTLTIRLRPTCPPQLWGRVHILPSRRTKSMLRLSARRSSMTSLRDMTLPFRPSVLSYLPLYMLLSPHFLATIGFTKIIWPSLIHTAE